VSLFHGSVGLQNRLAGARQAGEPARVPAPDGRWRRSAPCL